ANYGISLIFFFYGVKLNIGQFKNALMNWKLHILIQLSTFLFFPLTVLALRYVFERQLEPNLWTGLFYLAALPSTVSSSVVMVSIARGNISAAIFNASISGLIGVLLTPLWMKFWMDTDAGFQQLELGPVLVKLLTQVIVPVFIGILLNKKLGWFAEKYKVNLKHFDQLIILLVIFNTFCNSFKGEVFFLISGYELLIVFVLIIVLFFFFVVYTRILANILIFSKEDKITAVFCGSKKSLVHGTVFSRILFLQHPALGIILLPIMIYHLFQLIISSIMANRFAKG
ncbi:bile acid:sodium symporter, partial [Pseudoxanthomonas sp. SGD-10]